MKVLFILENFYPHIGGVETLFKSLAESLVHRGHEVTVLTNNFTGKLSKTDNINGVEIRRLPFFNRYLFTFFAVFPCLKYARKADLIHTTSYNAGVPAFFAALLARKRVIITFHEVWGKLWFRLPFMNKIVLALHYIFEQFLLRLPFSQFIAVSLAMEDRLKASGIAPQKITTIHNGINYDEFKTEAPAPKNEIFTFLYFGRLGISKGLDILIDAMALFIRKGLPARFEIVLPTEPGGFYRRIIQLIDAGGLTDHVHISNHLSYADLSTKIRQSHAVVIPSYSEGFCYSAVESMALGTPVIASGRGALKEVVSGKHLLMDAFTADNLARKMEDAYMGRWAYKPEKRYPLDETVRGYIDLYTRLAESHV